MIQGTFGDEDELFFEIDLLADNGFELLVDAMLDTGFSGWLAIDKQDLEGFDWTYLRQQTMTTARGDVDFELYIGKLRIDGQEFDIPVHAGDGVPEILIGRKWLKNRQLLVDMESGVLTLGKS
ncbi:aspartyl protease [Limnofasciculus baicalensis]|uniref:Aspartyl protease n=1 Tax=Limnofasciculus baicalensis BBK-W-15 TaxID=2699891 RepID=A0AAE3GND9_9CYAN|nr:aspartyl protease [Limnofasciculus baicalensis]MCP2726953.1 aspartyl protease [Limnofasciculus baicalensis BBK-W-15]